MHEAPDNSDGVSIHAGFPNPAADRSLQALDFNKLLISHGTSTYMFRVRGSEWESVGVFDNDIAVVDRAMDPRKNDVTIWWNEQGGEFAIGHHAGMPKNATCWGVVTFTIHQLHSQPAPQRKQRYGT